MKRTTYLMGLIGLISLLLVGVANAAPIAPRQFFAPLTGAAEVPAVETGAVGMAIITVMPGESMVCSEVIVTGAETILAGHIHRGPATGTGGVVVNLDVTKSHSVKCQVVDPAVVGNISARPQDFYVNVHTEAAPGGEVRGQLRLPVAGNGFYGMEATLTGDQEVPAVATDGIGFANVVFHRMSGILCSSVVVDDIDVAFGSHIHAAPAGSNGGVVVSLGAIDGASRLCQRVGNDVINGFLFSGADQFYVNVHTDAAPSGELRGQLNWSFSSTRDVAIAPLSGAAEVPAVDSAGAGLAFVFIDHDASALCWSLIASDIGAASGAHIHVAPAESNGGVVVAFDPFEGFDSGCQFVDAEGLGGLSADWAGHYVNVHTEANPGGELRGQLTAL